MKAKLKGIDMWNKIEEDQDGLALIKLLQNITFHKDGSKQYMMELVEAENSLYFYFSVQRKHMTLEKYLSEIKARVQICESPNLNVRATKAVATILAVEDSIGFSDRNNKD